jgi:hypothetical protein
MEVKPNPTLVASSLALALPGLCFVAREEYTQASISFFVQLFFYFMAFYKAKI